VDSALHRVMMHLWPLALFTFFLWVASPQEALARDEPGPGRRELPGPGLVPNP
jgi:hypothetical protein